MENNKRYQASHTGTISVSQISNCLRRAYFEATLPFHVPPIAVTQAVKGIMLHEQLHHFFMKKEGALSEYALSVPGTPHLTGTLDLYYWEILYDFKVSKKVKTRFTQQLNNYRVLLGKPVKKMKVILLDNMFEAVDIPFLEIDPVKRAFDLHTALTTGKWPVAEEHVGECGTCSFIDKCNGGLSLIVR